MCIVVFLFMYLNRNQSMILYINIFIKLNMYIIIEYKYMLILNIIYITLVDFSELTSLNGTILMCVCLSVYVLYVCIYNYTN